MTKKEKRPKWQVGDLVTQCRYSTPVTRRITAVIENYLHTKGRFGYQYIDDEIDYAGMCSEEHLYQWSIRK